jgi:hypothetical protein
MYISERESDPKPVRQAVAACVGERRSGFPERDPGVAQVVFRAFYAATASGIGWLKQA